MDCRLTLTAGGARETFTLPDGITTVGRGTENDIQLLSETISRRHLQIANGPGVCELTDLGSRNGTFVNGESVQTIRLRHGDEIRIGSCVLLFHESSASAVDEAVPPVRVYSDRSSMATVRVKILATDEKAETSMLPAVEKPKFVLRRKTKS